MKTFVAGELNFPRCAGSYCDVDSIEDDEYLAEYEDAEVAFISRINQRVTVGCALPFNIPPAEMQRIIRDAFKYFIKEHGDYTYPEMLVIPYGHMNKWVHQQGVENIHTAKQNRRRGKIILPQTIEYVDSVFDMNRNFGESGGSRYVGGVQYRVPQRYGLDSQYSLADCAEYAICMLSFSDMLRMVSVPPVSTTFNPITKTLHFTGHIPTGSVVLSVRTRIDAINALNDELFFRYCVCQCKIELGEIIERYQFTLPGNISVKSPADNAQSEMEKIIEEIKSTNIPPMLVM